MSMSADGTLVSISLLMSHSKGIEDSQDLPVPSLCFGCHLKVQCVRFRMMYKLNIIAMFIMVCTHLLIVVIVLLLA